MITDVEKIEILSSKYDNLLKLHEGKVIALCDENCKCSDDEACHGFGVMCLMCQSEWPCTTINLLSGDITINEAIKERDELYND